MRDCSATLDDFDIMLLHEDFPHLLVIATKVKATHRAIARVMNPQGDDGASTGIASTYFAATRHHDASYRPKNALLPDEILRAVERMQQVLIQKKPSDKTIIPRGLYPITDSLMEDAMIALHQEYECGQEWLIKHGDSTNAILPSMSSDAVSGFHDNRNRYDLSLSSDNSSNTATGGPITIKYAKWQTDALMNWMIDNKDQPFPDSDAIELLVHQTGLTSSQIVNWTTNVRKRNRKATCENGKKPHHFLDFLFLVHDRETKKATGAAATKGGLTISTTAEPADDDDEYRITYGESPRIQEWNFVDTSKSVPQQMSSSSGRRFVFPSEPVLVAPSSQSHGEPQIVVQAKSTLSNRFVTDGSTNVNVATTTTTNEDTIIMDISEPIPLLAPSNDDIMMDFANSWLNDNRYMDTEMQLEEEEEDDLVIPSHPVNDVAPVMMDGPILPSVTDDSHDNNGHNYNYYHGDSLSVLGNLINDDAMFMDEWALYPQQFDGVFQSLGGKQRD